MPAHQRSRGVGVAVPDGLEEQPVLGGPGIALLVLPSLVNDTTGGFLLWGVIGIQVACLSWTADWRSGPGRASAWSTSTSTTPSGRCGSAC